MYKVRMHPLRPRGAAVALCACRRAFSSGLDPVQQRRLRRNSFVGTNPRGRDLFSRSFESRLRLCPLHELGELYAPVAREELITPSASDPLSSVGDPIEQRRAAAGDAVYERSLAAKRRVDAALRERHTWNVVVVGLIELPALHEPVSFPSPYPSLYHWWNAMQPHGVVRDLTTHTAQSYTMDAEIGSSSKEEECGGHRVWYWAAEHHRRLQKACDTTQLASHFTTTTTTATATASNKEVGGENSAQKETQHFHTVLCVEPRLDLSCYRREEAQVELMTAYRNILFEAAELTSSSSSSSSCADLVRVPVLSCDKCSPYIAQDMAKLSQQALIKGFHRLSPAAKETLLTNRAFHVELYVPPSTFERFAAAFRTEAWDVPHSIIDPGRTALYPGLAPPRSLLVYDGWVGKRAEIVQAIETQQDVSLLASGAKQIGLDGSELVVGDVCATVSQPISSAAEFQRRLAAEEATAKAQHLVKTETLPEALRPGLQGNAADDDDDQKKDERNEQGTEVTG